MKVIYIPVYKVAVNYDVEFGRRWSLLEHLLLVDLIGDGRTVEDIAKDSDTPQRLVIEALINLLRMNWVEVRSTQHGVFYTTTAAGARRASEEKLPLELKSRTKWISLCVDRLVGSWMRSDDVNIVYAADLPNDAECILPTMGTIDLNHPSIRDLLYLDPDESLQPVEPRFRSSSQAFARITLEFDNDPQGLPQGAPIELIQLIQSASKELKQKSAPSSTVPYTPEFSPSRDNITLNRIVAGGSTQLKLLQTVLRTAKSEVIIHSCFLSSTTVKILLPDFESAAKRKVRIELLWGIQSDALVKNNSSKIVDVQKVLNALPPSIRSRVSLSPNSSSSHAKIILYNEKITGKWVTVISSCNFLSTAFDALDISVIVKSQTLASQILAWLISSQIPSSGPWPAVVRRLNSSWNELRKERSNQPETGSHGISLLMDGDHYAAITNARDRSSQSIAMGCDLFGVAAETSAIAPMERAAELGSRVVVFYQRPSDFLKEEGRTPEPEKLAKRGITIQQVPELHGKFLLWDEEDLIVSSFNWLATVSHGSNSFGSEIGAKLHGPQLRSFFLEALRSAEGTERSAEARQIVSALISNSEEQNQTELFPRLP